MNRTTGLSTDRIWSEPPNERKRLGKVSDVTDTNEVGDVGIKDIDGDGLV